jgi:hypothetical protein
VVEVGGATGYGAASWKGSGGGGAGEMLVKRPYSVTPGNGYSITIGAAAATDSDGSDTVFGSITAKKGLKGAVGNIGGGGFGGEGGGSGFDGSGVKSWRIWFSRRRWC